VCLLRAEEDAAKGVATPWRSERRVDMIPGPMRRLLPMAVAGSRKTVSTVPNCVEWGAGP